MPDVSQITPAALRNLVRNALAEDIGSGDATTLSVVPAEHRITAQLRSREACVISGLMVAEMVFAELDPAVRVTRQAKDGDACQPGDVLATISGPARAILTGERTALNFMQRMTGIATLTRRFVDQLRHSKTRLLDTRKTTPGLRLLEKYAVTCGGGQNHRFGLYDRVMIKDNHLAVAALTGPGGLERAVQAARSAYPKLQVEVEADRLDQVEAALQAQADFILLDNMSTEQMAAAVAMRDRLYAHAQLEASGNMTLDRLPDVAATGVDFISVGALTHSARAVDLGLDIDDIQHAYPDTAD